MRGFDSAKVRASRLAQGSPFKGFILGGLVASGVIFAGASSGVLGPISMDVDAFAPGRHEGAISESVAIFGEVMELADRVYVEPLDPEKNFGEMITGALRAFDKYGAYLNQSEVDQLIGDEAATDDSGRSIGVVGRDSSRGYFIDSVFPGSPAEEAGLMAGDVIIGVGEMRTNGAKDAVDLISKRIEEVGAGGEFSLLVRGVRSARERVLHVRPRSIRSPHAYLMGLNGAGVARVLVRRFYPGVGDDVLAAIDQARRISGERGPETVKTVALDMRGNGGGLTTEAVAVAGLFLPRGSLVFTMEGRALGHEDARTQTDPELGDLTVIPLVDCRSASASEIVTSALQVGGSPVVGWTTYGKGSVQRIFSLGDKGALKITIATYVDPAGRRIDGVGVHPDVEMSGACDDDVPGLLGADPLMTAVVALSGGTSWDPL
jgi:carboxyl-terminal processing protease